MHTHTHTYTHIHTYIYTYINIYYKSMKTMKVAKRSNKSE